MNAAPDLGEFPKSFPSFKNSGTPVTIYNPPGNMWYQDIPKAKYSSRGSTVPKSQVKLSFAPDTVKEQPTEFSIGAETGEPPFEGPTFMQLNDMYIITTIREGLIIIDQHVAHERILYEEILENLSGKQASSQQLLFPLTLDFSAADFDVLNPMIPHLNKIGFGIREFGERSVMVDGIPAGMSPFENGRILSEFIEEMRVYGKITSGYLDKLAAALACRSAIKAGKPLNQTEMQYLIDRLFATKSPFICPHGRPTIVKLSLKELDRRFGR